VEAEAGVAASEADEVVEPAPLAAEVEPPAEAEPATAPEATAAIGEPADSAEEPDAPAPPIPLGIRAAGRTIVTYAAPRYGSDMRGRIDSGRTFAIYELLEGTDCAGEGWARVDHDSFACLKHAVADDRPPVQLPTVPE